MDIKLSNGAKEIIALLEAHNHKAYAVGGCIRDQVMGIVPYDFDITTDATAKEMLDIFSSYRVLTTGIKHGTVAVIINKEVFECTTFRIDGAYSDSRHPNSVTFSRNLSDDLARRDFTVNALCYNENDGIIDLFGGIGDIENKIIRCIGEAEKRFTEDALRILRGMRFSSTLGFEIEEATKSAMLSCAPLLNNISKERVTAEFEKMLTGKNIGYILESFSQVFRTIIPDIQLTENTIAKLSASPADFEYRTALLIKDNPKNKAVLTELKLPKRTCENILQLSLMENPINKIELKKMLCEFKEENVVKFISFSSEPCFLSWYKEIKDNNECYSLDNLDISGKDILKLGIEPQNVGKTLNKLLQKVINEEIENKKEELIKAVH